VIVPRIEFAESLSVEELHQQSVEHLPDREAMALINANLALPINVALAANVLSDHSTAIAAATQDAFVDQST
jgi:hypothetical protein